MLGLLIRIKKGVVSSFLLIVMAVGNFQGVAYASAISLPAPQQLLGVSSQYSLPLLKGLRLNPKNPLHIEFIVDNANQSKVSKEDAAILIRYFLAGLTMSEKDLWVNLSPYESDRVIPEAVGKTDLGRDMLAQDYILKQLASSLTYPESEIGKKYWQSMNNVDQSFNKIWIAPAAAEVYEHANIAIIHAAKLKAMMEEDYLAMQKNGVGVGSKPTRDNGQVMNLPLHGNTNAFKTHILPVIENEINTGKNFANLRQIYSALILAKWFKEKFKASFYKDYINQKKISKIDIHDPQAKDKIYDLYTQAFKKGVYDYIRKESVGANNYSPVHRITKRRYFSGGVIGDVSPVFTRHEVGSDAALAAADKPIGTETLVRAGWKKAGSKAKAVKVDSLASEVSETFQNSMDDSPIYYGYVKPGTQDLDRERNQQVWVDFGKELKRIVKAKRGRCAIFLPAERFRGTSWSGPDCTVSLEVVAQPRKGVLELLLTRSAGKEAYRKAIEFDSINDKIISRGKQVIGIGAPVTPHAKVLYEKMIDAGNAVGADVNIGSVLENRSGVLVTLANGLKLHYDRSKAEDHLVITSPAASDTPWVKVVRYYEDGGGRAFRLKQTVVDITASQAGGEFTCKRFYDGDSLDRPSEEIKTSCRIVGVHTELGKIVIVLDGIKDEKIDAHFFREMEEACPGIRFVVFDRQEGIDRNQAWSIAQGILGEIKRNQANFIEHGEYKTLGVSSQCPEVNFNGHEDAYGWNQQWQLQLDVNLQRVSDIGDLRRGLEHSLGFWYRHHLAELEDARAKRPKSLSATRKGEEQYQDAMDQGFVAALNIKPDERVLDVGTRLGNIAVVASRYSDHVVGIDISEKMVEEAKKIHADNKKISFKVGDIAGYGIEDDSIDVATVAYVLSGNLSFDRLAALKRLNEAIKVGGRIGIFDYSPEGGGNGMWSKAQWERFLTDAGFSNISVEHPRWIGPSGASMTDAEHFVIYAEKNQAIIADYAGKYRQVRPESDDLAVGPERTDLGGITMNGIKVKTSEGSLPVEFAAVGPEFFNTAMLQIISMQPINSLVELAK